MYTVRLKNKISEHVLPTLRSLQPRNLGMRIMFGIFVVEIALCSFFIARLLSPDKISYTTIVEAYNKPGLATEQFMSELTSRGLNPVLGQKITRDSFSVGGVMVALVGDNIQVFEYIDHFTAIQDISRLKERYAVQKKAYSSNETMYVYTKDTLNIFYMGNNKNILDILSKNAELSLVEPKTLVLN